MDKNIAKIRLKIGQFEIEYEGNEAFLEDEIYQVVEKMASVHAKHIAILPTSTLSVDAESSDVPPSSVKVDLAISTIAEHLNVKTGVDLVIAAMAYLALVKNKTKCSRDEIRDTMRSDESHYRNSMSNNLKRSLQNLVKDRCLNKTSDGQYVLSAQKRKEIESVLL